jgi:D-alanyl-D-alanine carboxypeptidase
MASGEKNSHRNDLLKDRTPLPFVLAQRRCHRLLRGVLLVAALLAVAAAATAAGGARTRPIARRLTLGQRIDAILRRTEARRGLWGIEVVRLSDGKVLFTRNADHLFLPASNMKLFTTAAAIEKLGPDFVFRTTVEAEAAPDSSGRVGDLFLVGRGPAPRNLRTRFFRGWQSRP